MIINLNQGEKCQALLTVEIPAETVSTEREDITRQFLRLAKVPGYRPGKVPRKLIERRYAPGICEELEKRLKEKALKAVREKKDIQILGVTKVELNPNVDDTYTVSADILVAPEFELPEYKGIPITLPKAEVLDEHLEKLIDRWKEQNAGYQELEEGSLEMGQYAVLDYKGFRADGEPFVGEDSPPLYRAYFEREDAWMWMDEESFLPGFCGELLDHQRGDHFEFTLSLPDDFAEEELRGTEVRYEVTLKQIMRKDLPDLTDEKVKETSEGAFETVESFKQDLTERLESEMKQSVDEIRSRKALEYLHGLIDFELPDVMVNQETQHHVNRIVNDSQRRGVDENVLLEKEQEIIDAAGAMGRRDVKTKFILNEIAQAEGLKVAENEVLQRVQLLAAQSQMSSKKALRVLRENGQLNSIAEEILFGKSLDFVKENASINVDEAQNALDLMWDSESASQ